jgi:uncharacterized protein YjbK
MGDRACGRPFLSLPGLDSGLNLSPMNRSNQHLEIEIKLQLPSFPEYLKLLGFVGNAEREEQLFNCFFDSTDRQLAAAGYAYRVRLSEETALVTVKGLPTQEGVAVIRSELEAPIGQAVAKEIQGGRRDCLDIDAEPAEFVKSLCRGISMTKLVEFTTVRRFNQFRMGDDRCLLQIDKTDFSDGSTDYELEVEVPGREQIPVAENCLRRLFDSLKIPFGKQSDSKLARALSRV